MLNFKTTLKPSAEHELDISEIKHMLKGLAELGCKEMRYQAHLLAALAQKSRKVYSIITVKLLKKLPSFERHHGDYSTGFTNYLCKIRTIASDNRGLQNIHKTLLLPMSYSSCVLIKSV